MCGVDWIVDGMNLMGSRPDGWWRDRAAARRRQVATLAALSEREGATITVVFDGRDQPEEVADGAVLGVRVVFAPGGRDAADDVITAMAGSLADPLGSTVVTSDAGLARRVRRVGVAVMGVSAFGSRLAPAGE